MTTPKRTVWAEKLGPDLRASTENAMRRSGLLDRVQKGMRVALKPNLTYPYHKPGVTTSPAFIRAVVEILKERTDHIAVVETDGGYGVWKAETSFEGHLLPELKRDFGVEIVNLCTEASSEIEFRSGWRKFRIPLPNRLLKETDLFITLPVPKIHAMTILTLAYKNQWGCVPDIMRLRRHFLLNHALVAINQALRPAVVADGSFFLDVNGPLDGQPVPMNLVIAASDAGAFDRYASELMRVDWRKVPHLRAAVALGDMPETLSGFDYNIHPAELSSHAFTLARSPRNLIALAGFRSRFLTWLGYESWFGRVVLHGILYAIVGRPVKPQAAAPSSI